MSTTELRENLISSASKFLSDEKVASTPLAKKIAFLESKGLNAQEIEEAMRRSSSSSAPPVPPPTYLQQQVQQVQPWSARVRDLSIVAAFVGGLGYSAYQLYHVCSSILVCM